MSDQDKPDLSMFLDDYLHESIEGFQKANTALLDLEKDPSLTEQLDGIFRVFHTLKSSSSMLGFSGIASLAHNAEDLLDRLRKQELAVSEEVVSTLFDVIDALETMVRQQAEGKKGKVNVRAIVNRMEELADHGVSSVNEEKHTDHTSVVPTIEKLQTIRVDVDLLDSLFDLVGELIITKNRIDSIVVDFDIKELKASMATMGRMIDELQENVSTARMVPVDEVFRKFPRMVRDLAHEHGKKIELDLQGREIELDKGVLDAIGEPLIHLLRNAVGHGIEPPGDRQKRNKPEVGTIKLVARRAENHIFIDVEDDGGGIDAKRMKEIALKKGFVEPEEVSSLSEGDILNLLFAPGFSSALKVTGLSGRGIGLDVVRTTTKALGGSVEVATQKGKGTRFSLRLPLTTAIMQTLMVGIGEQIYAISSDIVVETLEVRPAFLRQVRDEWMIVFRGQAIPFIPLQQLLNLPGSGEKQGHTGVILRRGEDFICLGVDTVLAQIENIVKPFDPIARHFRGYSGGVILADGRVALLLDVPTLFGFEQLREETFVQ